MLSKEVAKKIKEELSSFFDTELARFELYGSYAKGKESKYSDLRNSSPRLRNLLKHSIPVFADGTFTTVKGELQRMVDARIMKPKEDYLVVATAWIRSSGFSRNSQKRTTMWRKRRHSIGQ